MSPRTSGRRGRRALLAIPAIAVPVAIAAVILVPMQAIGAVDLPDKTPAQLLAFVESSHVDQLSGTIEQTSDLGIPDLSSLTGSADTAKSGRAAGFDDLLSLATGSYTGRVYLDGDRSRLQVLDKLAERNVYLDGSAGVGWFVDSESKTATRLSLPVGTDVAQLKKDAAAKAKDAEAKAQQRYKAKTGQALPTPQAMLDQALASLEKTTAVTVGTDTRVAGRDVYELVLSPRDAKTLVGSIRFDIDGQNGVALAASITARGADQPALRIAFTDVSFSAPAASAVTFTPGSDITVAQSVIPLPNATTKKCHRSPRPGASAFIPTVIGSGWSGVLQAPSAKNGASPLKALTAQQRKLLDTVTTAVAGGRVLQTSLVTVLLTDDGRVFAGAVPAERLVEAAASGR